MKAFIYSIFLAICPVFFTSQIVNIPDQNFKTALLFDYQINTNKDGEIQVSEAEAAESINCFNREIQSLEGIQSFKNLKKLTCTSNQLSTIDVSKNLALTSLVCGSNKLTSIDVSNNLLLDNFWVENNLLTSLDVSKNVALKSLYANNNFFTSLDLSHNINLGYFLCQNNLLTSLDLSNNSKLFYFKAYNNKLTSLNLKNGTNTIITYIEIWENPTLGCIQVDDVNYSTANWVKKDNTASYSTNCLLGTYETSKSQISIYPNPIKNILYFSIKSNVEIYNSIGQKLKSEKQVKTLDASKLLKGIYFIVLKDDVGKEIQKTKIIKE